MNLERLPSFLMDFSSKSKSKLQDDSDSMESADFDFAQEIDQDQPNKKQTRVLQKNKVLKSKKSEHFPAIDAQLGSDHEQSLMQKPELTGSVHQLLESKKGDFFEATSDLPAATEEQSQLMSNNVAESDELLGSKSELKEPRKSGLFKSITDFFVGTGEQTEESEANVSDRKRDLIETKESDFQVEKKESLLESAVKQKRKSKKAKKSSIPESIKKKLSDVGIKNELLEKQKSGMLVTQSSSTDSTPWTESHIGSDLSIPTMQQKSESSVKGTRLLQNQQLSGLNAEDETLEITQSKSTDSTPQQESSVGSDLSNPTTEQKSEFSVEKGSILAQSQQLSGLNAEDEKLEKQKSGMLVTQSTSTDSTPQTESRVRSDLSIPTTQQKSESDAKKRTRLLKNQQLSGLNAEDEMLEKQKSGMLVTQTTSSNSTPQEEIRGGSDLSIPITEQKSEFSVEKGSLLSQSQQLSGLDAEDDMLEKQKSGMLVAQSTSSDGTPQKESHVKSDFSISITEQKSESNFEKGTIFDSHKQQILGLDAEDEKMENEKSGIIDAESTNANIAQQKSQSSSDSLKPAKIHRKQSKAKKEKLPGQKKAKLLSKSGKKSKGLKKQDSVKLDEENLIENVEEDESLVGGKVEFVGPTIVITPPTSSTSIARSAGGKQVKEEKLKNPMLNFNIVLGKQ